MGGGGGGRGRKGAERERERQMFYLVTLSTAKIIESMVDKCKNVEHWWNDNDEGFRSACN